MHFLLINLCHLDLSADSSRHHLGKTLQTLLTHTHIDTQATVFAFQWPWKHTVIGEIS